MNERHRSVVFGLAPLVVAAVLVLTGDADAWWLLVILGIGALLGWFMLRRGRHTPWEEARERLAPGHAVVFWKPGCIYCERLLRALGDDRHITWVNVWKDEAANVELRRHNNGDELTPTALVGDAVLRNPSADELRAALT